MRRALVVLAVLSLLASAPPTARPFREKLAAKQGRMVLRILNVAANEGATEVEATFTVKGRNPDGEKFSVTAWLAQ